MVPLPPDSVTELQSLSGPAENTKEHAALEEEMKFSYRGLLGELLYAFIVTHVSIGNAIQLLSRFSSAPHPKHYAALKGVCKYLRAHKSDGLIYWRPKPVSSLPEVPFITIPADPKLPAFPSFPLDELVTFVDAAYATDTKTRRSVTGYVIMYAGAAIAYKAKLQATVSTSSTEAEFIASVYSAKAVKHLRSVLSDLQLPLRGPTIIYCDNKAAIAMINDSKPTPRSRHIDVQHFAIQEWRNNQEIEMRHISGILNPADDETKALSWMLHSRHSRRAMGHYGHPD